MSTGAIVGIIAAGALAEYALGRWGGPRWRSTAQALGNLLRGVAAPTLGRLPLAGPFVLAALEAAAPQFPPCATCAGSGHAPTAPKPAEPAKP